MRLPTTIGKYRIEKFLGGGMAEVYRAVDTVLGREVAFKQLTAAGVQDNGVRARFLEEAKVGGQLTHDNIVRTFDYGEDEGQPFIVMEFLRGSSLTTLIKSDQLGDWKERARIALEMARALEYLHGHKVLHRDIKPDNIHIDEKTRRVRLIDFGIAKTENMNLTQAGFVIGTPFYMAPEQLKGAPVGPPTDVYAFGLVFFEVLTGRRARPAETVERVLQQIMTEAVGYAPLDECKVPEALASIVRDTTKAEASERPDGFSSIIPRLEGWIESQRTGTQPVDIPAAAARPKRLSFGHMAALAVAAVIIGGLGVAILGVSLARAHLPAPVAAVVNPSPADEMIAIKGGNFEFGEDRRTVFVAPFKIDRTEVTNEKYAMFAKAMHRPLPPHFHADYPGQPVTYVTIDEARSYCFAQSKHLPTETQWERAARGVKGARFPWGDKADQSRANLDEGGGGHLVSADSMKEGASVEGVLHLVGNAAEWIDETRAPSLLAIERFAKLLKPPVTDNEAWYMIKGGSFRRSITESAPDLWLPAPGRYAADDVGFRCVRY